MFVSAEEAVVGEHDFVDFSTLLMENASAGNFIMSSTVRAMWRKEEGEELHIVMAAVLCLSIFSSSS